MKQYPTQVQIRDRYIYENGHLYYRHRVSNKLAGTLAGTGHNLGYRRLRIGPTTYYMNRLIYIYHHGAIPHGLEIDHINGIRDDNRIDNLRAVTKKQNCANRGHRIKDRPNLSIVQRLGRYAMGNA